MSDAAIYRRLRKVCHVCHRNAMDIAEMYRCIDCGERMCPDHAELAMPSMERKKGRPQRICVRCRQDNCESLQTCELWLR